MSAALDYLPLKQQREKCSRSSHVLAEFVVVWVGENLNKEA